MNQSLRHLQRALLLFVLVAAGACSTLAPLRAGADDTKTFTVIEGAAPWFDRVGNWSLTKVPDSLNGSGPVPQQSCSSRSLEITGKPKSIVLGVSANDAALFEQKFPAAKETGESIAVKNTGGAEIPYKVLTLASPPDRIEGAGIYGAGLLLLKTDGSAYKPAAAAPAKTAIVSTVVLPKKANFQLYLLIGQSNMVGRDTSGIETQIDNPRILALDGNNHWVVAREPMHVGGSGMGPGIPFAAALLKTLKADPKVIIGLIPCAVGGTPLSRWVKGADLYTRAVARAKAAAESGVIKGALWHQGESDTNDQSSADTYGARLTQMFTDLRHDLGLPRMPIVVGQLGMYLTAPGYPYIETLRAAIAAMPHALPGIGIADSQGLTDKGDHLHFSSASQAQFGLRYAKAMVALQKGKKPTNKLPAAHMGPKPHANISKPTGVDGRKAFLDPRSDVRHWWTCISSAQCRAAATQGRLASTLTRGKMEKLRRRSLAG